MAVETMAAAAAMVVTVSVMEEEDDDDDGARVISAVVDGVSSLSVSHADEPDKA